MYVAVFLRYPVPLNADDHLFQMREDRRAQIEILKEGERVRVNHEPMFIFLLHNGMKFQLTVSEIFCGRTNVCIGTVISIHPNINSLYTAPITERLHRRDSVLRSSEDASLLVQSLLDLSTFLLFGSNFLHLKIKFSC